MDEAITARRALVVDDDAGINRLVAVRLKTRGFDVDSATNGEDALRRVVNGHPDLVFLDVSMPGMSGLDVLQHLRSQELDLAVIMMTAFGSEEIAVEALRQGADDYLRKPFEPREFQAVLERTVARLELTRQNTFLRRQLEAELARAAEVQAELLPREVPALPGFELAARCVPAREVGGDFYDWLETSPGVLRFTLGDVMGKGMPAALLMATTRAVLRTAAGQNPPAEAVRIAARATELDLERSGSYVTLFHAELDVQKHRLQYVDAGHGHVFIRRSSGAIGSLGAGGLPIGLLQDQTYEQGTVELHPGDTLVVYSDGLVEAHPSAQMPQEEIAAHLNVGGTAQQMAARLIDLAACVGHCPDDLTVVVLRCLSSHAVSV